MVPEEMAWVRFSKTAPKPEESQYDPTVSFGGRIKTSTRRRMRLYAAISEREIQEMLEEALVEWLDRNGG